MIKQGGYVPSQKAPGFWVLPSTLFLLQEAQWEDRTWREVMHMLNCTEGELLEALCQALDGGLIKRRKPKPVFTLRQRLIRAERASLERANPALRAYMQQGVMRGNVPPEPTLEELEEEEGPL